MEKIIEVKNLIKVYDQYTIASKIALQNINMDVQKGNFICIMGSSGSGKTTLLNILSTIDNPTSGTVSIFGKNILTMSENEKASIRKSGISFIYQEYNLIDSLLIRDNILFSVRLNKMDVNTQKKELEKIVKKLGIEDIVDKYPFECSGGQKQRAAIARALIVGADIIFADEPTGNLDSSMAKELMALFVAINKEFNTTIVLVTHDCLIASYSKEIYYIEAGSLAKHFVKGDLLQKDYYNYIIKVVLQSKI